MSPWQKALWIPLAAVLAVGCAAHSRDVSYAGSKFQLIMAQETLVGGKLPQMTEQDVQAEVDRLLALEPAAPVPSRILLYQVESSRPSEIHNPRKILLLHKETSETMKEGLEETGVFDQIDFLPEIYLPEGQPIGLKELRIAAARAHADGLLMYSTETGYEYNPNWLSVLYLTVIGAYLVPGSELSSLALSKAVLVDVRTGYVYDVMETYGDESVVRPWARLDTEQIEYDARLASVSELANTVADRAEELAAKE